MGDELGTQKVDFVDLKLAAGHDGDKSIGERKQEEEFVLKASFPELKSRFRLAFHR